MMKRLYFDISDIVAFSRKNSRVTGMQRVQARLIGLLSQVYGGDAIRCVFARSRSGRVWECPASGLFQEIDFSPGRLLATLGLGSPAAPYEHEVRAYLKKNSSSRSTFVLAWWKLAMARWAGADQLAALGLTPAERVITRVRKSRLRVVPQGNALVLLGSTWAHPSIQRLASRTAAGGGEVVTLIHDVLPVTHPQFFTDGHVRRFGRFLSESAGYTTRYLCTSQYTEKHLRSILAKPCRQAEIAIVPLAHEFLGFPRNDRSARPTPATETALDGRPFVLCVGTIEIRKNGATLLRAWRNILDELGEGSPRLVFAGRRGWKLEEFDEVLQGDPLLRESVRILDSVSDADLAYLYQTCLFTVFPSLAEGWGLPVGESMWFGRHCVASSATAIPEVGEGLVESVDAHDVSDLASAIRRYVSNDTLLRECEKRLVSARLRTWADTAAHLAESVGVARGVGHHPYAHQ